MKSVKDEHQAWVEAQEREGGSSAEVQPTFDKRHLELVDNDNMVRTRTDIRCLAAPNRH